MKKQIIMKKILNKYLEFYNSNIKQKKFTKFTMLIINKLMNICIFKISKYTICIYLNFFHMT